MILAQELHTSKCSCLTLLKFHLLFSSVQSLSRVQLFATPGTAAHQSPWWWWSHHQLPELTQTHVLESVMPSNHLILCRPLLLLPSIFPNIRVFSNESVLPIKWPKYWSFCISPSNDYSGLTALISLKSKGLSSLLQHRSSKHWFFGTRFSLWANSSYVYPYMTTGKTSVWLYGPLLST